MANEGQTMTQDNALIYRRVFPIDQDCVVIEEKWDLTHPDCPFIRNPWSEFPLVNRGYRQVIMTKEEFSQANVPLKAPPSRKRGR
jgi:hypothetical protein